MQKLSKKGLAEVTELLEQNYNEKISDKKLKFYYALLSDIEDEKLYKGVIKLLQERKYNSHKFPQVSEIREFCGMNEDESETKAIIAKDKLKKAMRFGAYQTVIFDDPIIHKIVDSAGGWIKLNKMAIKDVENLIKFEFEKNYKTYLKVGITEIPKILFGIHDNYNNVDDGRNAKVIGDNTKACRWLLAYEKKYNNSLGVEKTHLKEIAEQKEYK